jgi:fumarate reductase subunit C
MLLKIKNWWADLKSYDKFFFITFVPAILFTLWGLSDLYINYFDLLSKEDHLQFFLRFAFPISLATLITVLELNKRRKLVKGIKDYLDK